MNRSDQKLMNWLALHGAVEADAVIVDGRDVTHLLRKKKEAPGRVTERRSAGNRAPNTRTRRAK